MAPSAGALTDVAADATVDADAGDDAASPFEAAADAARSVALRPKEEVHLTAWKLLMVPPVTVGLHKGLVLVPANT